MNSRMGYRLVVLMMVFFVATGFSWGKKDTKKEEKKKETKSSYQTAREESSTMTQPSSSDAEANPQSGEFPTRLISTLAEGDEATRKARIDSLKRLSTAMAQMRANQAEQVQSATAATKVAQTARKRAWY